MLVRPEHEGKRKKTILSTDERIKRNLSLRGQRLKRQETNLRLYLANPSKISLSDKSNWILISGLIFFNIGLFTLHRLGFCRICTSQSSFRVDDLSRTTKIKRSQKRCYKDNNNHHEKKNPDPNNTYVAHS